MKRFKVSNLIFVILISAVIIAGLVCVITAPNEINEYENRTSEKIKAFDLSSFADSSFQDSIETALADQIPFAENFKQFYNFQVSKFTAKTLNYAILKGGKAYAPGGNEQEEKPPVKPDEENQEYAVDIASLSKADLRELESFDMTLSEIYPKSQFDPNAKYNRIGDFWLWKGHLIYDLVYPVNGLDLNIDGFTSIINSWIEENPDTQFYTYFLEQETEMNFLTGEQTGLADYIFDKINIPDDHKSITRMHSFMEFDDEFFKTDHHWNHRGAYRGYKTMLASLLPEEEPLEVVDEWYLGKGSGSKSRTAATASMNEDFYVYEFDYPEFNIQINRAPAYNYGNQEKYWQDARNGYRFSTMTYGELYGWDLAEVKIDRVEDTGNGNIMVLGSSYDNAVVKLLASHYDCLYVLDFRYYDNTFPFFNMSNYIKEHNIDTVLFFGDASFYSYYGYKDSF